MKMKKDEVDEVDTSDLEFWVRKPDLVPQIIDPELATAEDVDNVVKMVDARNY